MTAAGEKAPARAALFDVDGTLIDSNELHVEAWRDAFAHFGIDVPADRIRDQIGKGGDNLLPALLPQERVEREGKAIEEYRTQLFKSDFLSRARPFPGVRALFERLHGDGVAIVLASSSGREELDHYVALMEVGPLLTAVTSKDDVAHSKPCPDIFAAALAKVAPVEAADALVVGDSPYDAEAARKVGIAMIALRCGGFPEARLREAGACMVFDDVEDLLTHYGRAFVPPARAA